MHMKQKISIIYKEKFKNVNLHILEQTCYVENFKHGIFKQIPTDPHI